MNASLRFMGAAHGSLVFGRRVEVLATALAPLLPRGRCVDVGCGDGSVARAISEIRPDIAPQGFDVLVREEAVIPVSAFDGHSLPLAGSSAESTLLIDVLHHADDPAGLLAECARVAPVVVVKDHFARNRFDQLVLAFMDWVGNGPHGVHLEYRYFSPAGWSDTLRQLGLSCEELKPLRGLYPFPFSLLFGRNLHFIARLRRA